LEPERRDPVGKREAREADREMQIWIQREPANIRE
jgi:hypothetical protein